MALRSGLTNPKVSVGIATGNRRDVPILWLIARTVSKL